MSLSPVFNIRLVRTSTEMGLVKLLCVVNVFKLNINQHKEAGPASSCNITGRKLDCNSLCVTAYTVKIHRSAQCEEIVIYSPWKL